MENNNKINHQGNLNPMWGKKHSAESKQKINDSQKLRYQQLNNPINNVNHVTMDEYLQEESFQLGLIKIIKNIIKKYYYECREMENPS